MMSETHWERLLTDGQTPLWLRRTVLAGLPGGLLLVGKMVRHH